MLVRSGSSNCGSERPEWPLTSTRRPDQYRGWSQLALVATACVTLHPIALVTTLTSTSRASRCPNRSQRALSHRNLREVGADLLASGLAPSNTSDVK